MTRPQVERAMTREELMAMREVAAKHWLAGHETGNWPSGSQSHAGEVLARKKALQAYLDREYPLPAPEPQQVTGPSGQWYQVQTGSGLLSELLFRGLPVRFPKVQCGD